MKRNFLILLVSLLVLVMGFTRLANSQLANIPREETLIVDVPEGRAIASESFNIFTTTWNVPSRGIHQLMLESIWMDDYIGGETISVLAANPPIYNEDFTQMTMKLREGCYWSDGVPITADDIVYGIETTLKDSGMAYSAQLNLYVDKVYKTDDYTVVFELKEPNSRFHIIFLDRWGGWRPFPKHIFEKIEDPVSFKFNPPVSSGPYVLKDYDPAGYWTLWERREDWDKTPTGMLYGMPRPKYVLFQYFPEETTKIIAQMNHNLDMGAFSMEGLRTLLSRNLYSRGYRKEFPWLANINPCMTGITFNNDVYPYKIKDVRWALTLAIDMVDYTGIAFDGAVTIGTLHLPPSPFYQGNYYRLMDEWLRNFTLDIEVNEEPFKPYDPDASLKLAEYAKSRGYNVPEDPEEIKEIFGPGWWKYAPEVAEQLLLRNGFTRDADGKWLLPDGTPWKIEIATIPDITNAKHRNALAAAQQWRNFGINVSIVPSEADDNLAMFGNFEVITAWPATEPWGAHTDLYRVFNNIHSKYYKPNGEASISGTGPAAGRWRNPRMDKIIEEMEKLDWNDPKNLELGMEGLKILIEEMPTIPTFGYPGVVGWDEYYWTNYPGAENLYCFYYHNNPLFKYMLPFLKQTGKQ